MTQLIKRYSPVLVDGEDVEPRVRVGRPLENDILLPPCPMQALVADTAQAIERNLCGACIVEACGLAMVCNWPFYCLLSNLSYNSVIAPPFPLSCSLLTVVQLVISLPSAL